MLKFSNIDDFIGYGECVSVSNEEIEIIIPKNFGPRILYFGYKGGFNHLCEHGKLSMDVNGETWKMYGGHRFWHSPEQSPRTYIPDNSKVNIEITQNKIVITQDIEEWTQIQKVIEIVMPTKGRTVEIIHRLKNCNAFNIEVSIWALTTMNTGGIHILPLNNNDTGFLANRFLSIWPYTDLKDERLEINNKYISLRQSNNEKRFKLGCLSNVGKAAYLNKDEIFIKEFEYKEESLYPDGNCNYEFFTNEYMLEMESLSPLYNIKPNQEKIHIEKWSIDKIDKEKSNIQDIVKMLLNN